MKMKKWFKCLLMTMALMMVVGTGTVGTTIPAAAKAKTETVKVGRKFWKGKFQYKVTSLTEKTGTAALIGTKTKKMTSVTVMETVKLGKYTLTVTEIGANAFKNCKKLKTVTTNTKIKKIGKSAFKGCKKLAVVDIKSKELSNVGKNALKGISKDAVVTAPAGTGESYEELLGVDVVAPAAQAAALKQLTKPVPAPVKKTETEAKAETEAKVETKAKAETEAAVETEAETKAEPQTEAVTEAETEAAVETEAETKAETQTEAVTEAETEAAVETEVETEAAVKTEAETEEVVETEAETETKVETDAVAEPETKTEAPKAEETETETEAQTELATEAETEAPTEPETEAPKAEETTPEPTPASEVKAPAAEAQKAPAPKRKAKAPASEKETCGEKHLGLVEVASVAPTCTETGLSAYEYCTVCGYKTEPIVLTALGHSYGEWTVAQAATCTEAGTEERSCVTCGAKETKAIAATGHTLGEPEIVPIPGSDCYGREVRKCVSCDYVEKSSYPTHRKDVMVQQEDIPATCTTSGKTNRWYCPYCKLENFSYVKPLGHKYSAEWTTEEGTCAKAGIRYRKCEHDGCTAKTNVEETAKAAGHQWEPYTLEATCTEAGFAGKKCSICGELDGEKTQPLGHEYKTTTVKASCEENGTKTETCSRCGKAKTTVLPASGEHEWVNHPQVAATCSTAGHSAYTQCAQCGEYKAGAELKTYAANGRHVWALDQKLYTEQKSIHVMSPAIKLTGCEQECNDHYGLQDAFVQCTECGLYRIVKVDGGHKWDDDTQCAFKTAVYNSETDPEKKSQIRTGGLQNNLHAYNFIQSTAFLVEKGKVVSGVSNSVFRAPFEVRVGGKSYNCYILMRRSDINSLQNFAPIVRNGDSQVTWKQVVNTDGSLGASANDDPFYKADGNIYMACFN